MSDVYQFLPEQEGALAQILQEVQRLNTEIQQKSLTAPFQTFDRTQAATNQAWIIFEHIKKLDDILFDSCMKLGIPFRWDQLNEIRNIVNYFPDINRGYVQLLVLCRFIEPNFSVIKQSMNVAQQVNPAFAALNEQMQLYLANLGEYIQSSKTKLMGAAPQTLFAPAVTLKPLPQAHKPEQHDRVCRTCTIL